MAVDFDMLKQFILVAENQSITAASKKLFISQQGLNKSMTHLENEVGARLLSRNRQGVRLTAAGERFLIYAKQADSDLGKAIAEAASIDGTMKVLDYTTSKIAATTICMHMVVQPLMERGLLQRANLQECETDTCLRSSKVDCVYVLDLFEGLYSLDDVAKTHTVELIRRSKMGLIASKEHFPGLPKAMTREQAQAYPLGLFNTNTLLDIARNVFGEGVVEGAHVLTTNRDMLMNNLSAGNAVVFGDQILFEYYRSILGKCVVFSEIEGCVSNIASLTRLGSSEGTVALAQSIRSAHLAINRC